MGCSVAAAPLEKVLICPMKRSCQANEGRYKPSAWVLGSGRSCIRKRRSWYSGQRPFRTTMENYSTLLHRACSIPGERGTLRDQLFAKMMTSPTVLANDRNGGRLRLNASRHDDDDEIMRRHSWCWGETSSPFGPRRRRNLSPPPLPPRPAPTILTTGTLADCTLQR